MAKQRTVTSSFSDEFFGDTGKDKIRNVDWGPYEGNRDRHRSRNGVLMKIAANRAQPVTARRKPAPLSIPTLKERATVLIEEILEAPAEEQCEILTGLRDMLDARLDDLAEAKRPKGEHGIPVGWIRQQMDVRGGHCHCRSLIEALKDAS